MQVELIVRDTSNTKAAALEAAYDMFNHRLHGAIGCYYSSQSQIVHEVMQ